MARSSNGPVQLNGVSSKPYCIPGNSVRPVWSDSAIDAPGGQPEDLTAVLIDREVTTTLVGVEVVAFRSADPLSQSRFGRPVRVSA